MNTYNKLFSIYSLLTCERLSAVDRGGMGVGAGTRDREREREKRERGAVYFKL